MLAALFYTIATPAQSRWNGSLPLLFLKTAPPFMDFPQLRKKERAEETPKAEYMTMCWAFTGSMQ